MTAPSSVLTTESSIISSSTSTASISVTATTADDRNSIQTNSNHDHDNSNNNDDNSCVQVAVRVRPMLPHEAGNTECVEVLSTNGKTMTVVRLGGNSGPKFAFDEVFPTSANQHDMYQNRVAKLVSSCLEGYNATILAYGQTGSGKTHTIMGPSTSITSSVLDDEMQAGVIPRAIRNVFDQLQQIQNKAGEENSEGRGSSNAVALFEYDVRVQFLEVYGEEIRDLLSLQQPSQKLSIRDVGMDEPEVVGATERKVDSAEEALLCLTRGMYRRVTGATAMNESSSRSHAILSLIVEQSTTTTNSAADDDDDASSNDNNKSDNPAATEQQQHIQAKRSKFNFVDLAGSERQKRTQASGQRLKEGIDINKGLLVLGNVISALGDPSRRGKTFVPYRDSKLTRLLKGSLGGNHKTLMIACVSPAAINMEETLNCLRYANRAKNIQNHAVVNLDPSSRLLSELKGKLQMLASDLLKARDGKISECTIPIEIVEQLANGGNCNVSGSGDVQLGSPPAEPTTATTSSYTASRQDSRLFVTPSPPSTTFPKPRPRTRTATGTTTSSSSSNNNLKEELQKLKAENEVYRLRFESQKNGNDKADDVSDALQLAFIARAAEYEKEIAMLRQGMINTSTSSSSSNLNLLTQPEFDNNTEQPYLPNLSSTLPPRTPTNRNCQHADHERFVRSESPELSRLRAQAFGSMSQSQNLDAEMDAEEKAVGDLTTKYLKKSTDAELDDSLVIEHDDGNDSHHHHPMSPSQTKLSGKLEGDLFELSNSIDAKEELIQKLMLSQQKYEAMRDFYDKKLKEMGTLLTEKELETEKLTEELQKVDSNHARGKELTERLREKQRQVATLKKKQAELTRLTTVASKNQTQIERLRTEVVEMKHKKVDLQKLITTERKSHAAEVQKLKKESMQKDRELNKVKRASDRKAIEAQKAQQVAKSRLDQINHLKNKFKDTEKRQRMLTVKRGVMNKAGVDPIMVGRRQSKKPSNGGAVKVNGKVSDVDVDTLRDFFDQKVADMGRKESLAEKLAQEWEAHFELTSSREELIKEGYEDSSESIQSIDSQVQYKKERIRQLASRLGKRRIGSDDSKKSDEYLFDQKFRDIVGSMSETEASETAAKVLFGMVVRERRRIASLARTASSLDERVQEAEAAVTAKDAAFRAYVDEQRLETAALAQDQQEHILSLMELVREEPADILEEEENNESKESEKASNRRGSISSGNELSKLLVLANERVAALERQLDGLQNAREAVNKHREREEEARGLYEAKLKECNGLEAELSELRSALRRIRENYALSDNLFDTPASGEDSSDQASSSRAIFQIVNRALHPSPAKSRNKTKRLRSPSSSKIIPDSPSVSIKNQTKFVNTSDSDEMPDWAEDIMQDLAIIAEGKMPDSLLDSLEVSGRDSIDICDDAHRVENKDVFDRLSSPTKFTGIQKHKQLQGARSKKGKQQTEGASEGQRHRKMISRQVADSLDKVVIPEAKTPSKHLRVENNEQQQQKRSVFDRLVSPSNLTGTQKQRFQDKKTKRGRSDSINNHESSPEDAGAMKSDEKSADDLLDDILSGGSSSNFSCGSAATQQKTKPGTNKRNQPKELNVFERLNKTTTQAYAVKQNVNIAEKLLDDLLDEDAEPGEEHKSEPHHPVFERVDEYTKQNVFERLQKTTTEAYAVKHVTSETEIHDKREGSSHGHPASPTRQKQKQHHPVLSPKGITSKSTSPSEHESVFERLQKQTTEAYAQKKHPGSKAPPPTSWYDS